MTGSSPYIPGIVEPQQAFYWLVLTVVMFHAWWIWFARRFHAEFSLVERILAAFTATIAQILVVTFVLGTAHLIGWWELGLTNAAITVIVLNRAMVAGSEGGLYQEWKLAWKSMGQLLRSSLGLCAIAGLALFVIIWHFYIGFLLPPLGYDVWNYHLVWTALAHQERFLGPFALPEDYVNYYPMNTEVLFLWFIVGCGSPQWANIVQGLFAIAGVLACYVIAKNSGFRRVDAAISALMILSVPTVFHMMSKAYADLAIMGGMLMSLAFLSKRRMTFSASVLAGCAAGFILGAKGSTLYMYLSLLLFLIYRLFGTIETGGFDINRGFRRMVLRSAPYIVGFVAASLLLGSYFYLRNWFLTGNPTGIFTVRIAGITLFEGRRNLNEIVMTPGLVGQTAYSAYQHGKEWLAIFDGLFDPLPYFLHANVIGGWGPVWTCLLFPSMVFGLLWSIVERKWRLVAIVVCCLLPFILFSYNRLWVRFHFQVICAGTVMFAYLISTLRRTPYRRCLIAVGVLLMFISIFIATKPVNWLYTPDIIRAARNVTYENRDRFLELNSWRDPQFIKALVSVEKSGTTLALADVLPTKYHLAAWNSSMSNRVVWIPWDGSGTTWLEKIDVEKASAVYVGPNDQALQWVVSNPTMFRRLYGSEEYGSLFEVSRAGD